MRSFFYYLSITLFIVTGCTQSEATFKSLTVPARLLPTGCELAPQTGLPLGRSDRDNPITITDPDVTGMIAILMLQSEPLAQIDSAYLAGYRDKSGKENAVWAIQFRDAQIAKKYSDDLNDTHESSDSKFYTDKGSILVFAWTDNSNDLSCFNAIRGYLEKN
jgi:hypothetical protein